MSDSFGLICLESICTVLSLSVSLFPSAVSVCFCMLYIHKTCFSGYLVSFSCFNGIPIVIYHIDLDFQMYPFNFDNMH